MPEPDLHACLGLLAEAFVTSLAEGGESVLVHVVWRPDGPDVGVLPLEGAAPAEFLLGTVAPAEWAALGAATRGRVRPLDGEGPTSTAEVVVLVPREGDVVGRMRHKGELITDPPAYGLSLDCLQRALGLPTAPPQVPSVHWLATTWLEAVLRSPDPAGTAAAFSLGEQWSSLGWERIRQLVAGGHLPDPTMTPEDAAWFDEGSFSRWALTGRPSPAAMLREVAAVAGFARARHCAAVLADMGIDVGPSPLPSRRERRRAG